MSGEIEYVPIKEIVDYEDCNEAPVYTEEDASQWDEDLLPILDGLSWSTRQPEDTVLPLPLYKHYPFRKSHPTALKAIEPNILGNILPQAEEAQEFGDKLPPSDFYEP